MKDWLFDVDNLTTLAAWAGFALSVFQLLKSRTSLHLFLGCDQYEDRIYVSNKSAHDVTLSSAGIVTARGHLSDSSNEHCDEYLITPVSPRRLKARDEMVLLILFVNKAYHNKVHHQGMGLCHHIGR
ncbi:hypothetical protein [Gibbsiella quercinecans]|uniref:hypothetical protein n=1 Tax=Gibbsiella quercinecans TaxID=929813 RepID=UPI00104E55EC|nr:hypothetical protein [Gibbsiella quercinecans]